MARHSAGLLPYRLGEASDDAGGDQGGGDELLVFVAHMGGPFWARKDAGAWSIVKGEYDPASSDPQHLPRVVAQREFAEEIGVPAPQGQWLELGEIRQRGGKVVTVFAVEAPASLAYVRSNEVQLIWPRGSQRTITFPEVDRAEWMDVSRARERLVAAQTQVLDRLAEALGVSPPRPA